MATTASRPRKGKVRLIYSAHHTEQNSAVALKEFLEKKRRGAPRSKLG